ncbi:MAG: hypothetical protein NTU51_10475 [Bacteroidetes bacterium]|nr:hypothetical protein [Bacteroidota bacterium]
METLKIEKSKVKKLFKEAPEYFKEVLRDTFGKELFSEKITDRIKSFEDACVELKTTEESVIKNYDTVDEVAYRKLKLIAKALNEGWEPDWSNSSEYKWWPYFVWSSGSGFDFSLSYYHCDFANATVGSRLCFKTKELAQYAGIQFIELYRDFLTIK